MGLIFLTVAMMALTFMVRTSAFHNVRYSETYIRRLKHLFNLISIPIWLIITLLVYILTVIFEINLFFHSAVVVGVFITLFSLQLYLSYIRGEEARVWAKKRVAGES